MGLDKNTIVVFTSDNGPAYRGSPGMYKGRKTDFHEGGIRVPGIAWWPGKIEAGKVTDKLGHTNDLLPTFCELAKVPLAQSVDGISLLPLLLHGTDINKERGTVFWKIGDGYRGNYHITTDNKPKPYATEIARNDKWKLLAIGRRASRTI